MKGGGRSVFQRTVLTDIRLGRLSKMMDISQDPRKTGKRC